ncbi:unnamed protein product [Vitrella brassicaformis CCMP3155]|uniref:Protein kinase domain-containing protein n=1 Tax=Vitrella brassicaformis (strain CCMP3155) TaxID=1169540 RepID=A0A0G4GTI8_VITBC|nr:unnamed protein product [Vitrella brassicaformis CCMP3155]|eukprot:CEM34087.1 unnamed protein product [Vitrella brassicaformis CCMP3155]
MAVQKERGGLRRADSQVPFSEFKEVQPLKTTKEEHEGPAGQQEGGAPGGRLPRPEEFLEAFGENIKKQKGEKVNSDRLKTQLAGQARMWDSQGKEGSLREGEECDDEGGPGPADPPQQGEAQGGKKKKGKRAWCSSIGEVLEAIGQSRLQQQQAKGKTTLLRGWLQSDDDEMVEPLYELSGKPHSGVIGLLDLLEHEKDFYVVMEKCKMEKCKGIDLQRSSSLGTCNLARPPQICSLVHRDFKPDNLQARHEWDYLSRHLAPECYAHEYSKASDMFAVGVIL